MRPNETLKSDTAETTRAATAGGAAPRQRAAPAGRAPIWFRAATGALSRIAPPLAASVAERLFVTVPGRPLKASERAYADGARRVDLETPSGPVRAWRWGDAPETVLLVHGWGGRGPQLSEIARVLVARGYAALAWDMPGHGDRGHRTSLPEMARVTAAVARQSGPIAGVVAHSFGMATTLVATLDGLSPPRLVGVAPSALLRPITDEFEELTGFSPTVVERMRVRLSARLRFQWDELEAETLAPRVAAPSLVIHDRDDERVPLRSAEALARFLPRAEMVTTAGLGHTAILSDPGVLARIGEFFPRRA